MEGDNTEKKIKHLIAEGKIQDEKEVYAVFHDDDCFWDKFNVCNCNPWICVKGKGVVE